jgi:hypothetical protein
MDPNSTEPPSAWELIANTTGVGSVRHVHITNDGSAIAVGRSVSVNNSYQEDCVEVLGLNGMSLDQIGNQILASDGALATVLLSNDHKALLLKKCDPWTSVSICRVHFYQLAGARWEVNTTISEAFLGIHGPDHPRSVTMSDDGSTIATCQIGRHCEVIRTSTLQAIGGPYHLSSSKHYDPHPHLSSDGNVLLFEFYQPGLNDPFAAGSYHLQVHIFGGEYSYQQGENITKPDISEHPNCCFNYGFKRFDVSDDGTTVIAGDESFSGGKGAVVIFEYPQDSREWYPAWFIEGEYSEGLGASVSLSGNGQLLAASGRNVTRIYKKTDSNKWLQIGQTLPGDLSFISGSGSELVLGDGSSPSDGGSNGVVRVYRLSS